MLSTINLLIKVACFVNNVNDIFNINGADLNMLVQGGQLYWAIPFSKVSLVQDMLGYFYLVKITKLLITQQPQQLEKEMSADLESSKFYKLINVHLI